MRWGRSYERFGFAPYVSAADKRVRATSAAAKLAKKAKRQLDPVVLPGRTIASTFWGKAWCDNLESYADFAYRLDRGRSYLRAGAVVDLSIEGGKVRASVSGSELYTVEVTIRRLDPEQWRGIVSRCAGRVVSLVGLLQGRLPDEVMRLVTDKASGLFPEPKQVSKQCSCPDQAKMCKHVAATMYGVGARLDRQPELLFLLRGVDAKDLVDAAVRALPGTTRETTAALAGEDLGQLFGIDMLAEEKVPTPPPRKRARPRATPSPQRPGTRAAPSPRKRKLRQPVPSPKKKKRPITA